MKNVRLLRCGGQHTEDSSVSALLLGKGESIPGGFKKFKTLDSVVEDKRRIGEGKHYIGKMSFRTNVVSVRTNII